MAKKPENKVIELTEEQKKSANELAQKIQALITLSDFEMSAEIVYTPHGIYPKPILTLKKKEE